MATGTLTWLESDGKSVEVALLYTVAKGDVIYADSWLGIANGDGVSGDNISISIDRREYQFSVPSGLSVAKGAVVYIDTAQVGSGHLPADAAWGTSSGSGKIPLFKATAAKDENNVVTGILLPPAVGF